MCIAIVCFPGCDVINIEIIFFLSNEAVFLHNQNSIKKSGNKKHFSSFLMGFHLPKVVSDLKVRLKCRYSNIYMLFSSETETRFD